MYSAPSKNNLGSNGPKFKKTHLFPLLILTNGTNEAIIGLTNLFAQDDRTIAKGSPPCLFLLTRVCELFWTCCGKSDLAK